MPISKRRLYEWNHENCTGEVTLIKCHSLEYFKDAPLQLFPKFRVFFLIFYSDLSYNDQWKGSDPLYHMWKSMEAQENWTQTWDHRESDIKTIGYLQKFTFFFHDLLQHKPLAHLGSSFGTKVFWRDFSSVADWQLFNKS